MRTASSKKQAEKREKSAATTPAPKVKGRTEGRGLSKTREGVVVSNKMQKTVVVAVVRQVRHPQYGKFVRSTKKLMVHDEQGCGVGDRVEVVETRPLSRLKRWKVSRIVTRAS